MSALETLWTITHELCQEITGHHNWHLLKELYEELRDDANADTPSDPDTMDRETFDLG